MGRSHRILTVAVLLGGCGPAVAAAGVGEEASQCALTELDGTCASGGGEPVADQGLGEGAGSCGCGALKRADFEHAAAAGSRSLKPEELPDHHSPGESDDEASIVFLEGGRFMMGLVPADESDPTISIMDGEGPAREEKVAAFGLGKFEVSNRRFARFVERSGYVSEAEGFGWSFGVEAFISSEVNATITSQVANAPWWLPVSGADWRHPNGPDTSIEELMDHPVSQVSLRDAEAFCSWSRPGGRLPTEGEWEFAARGGKSQRRFPWGQSLLTGKKRDSHRMNVWQSELDGDLLKDGKVRNLYGYGEHALALVKEFYGAKNTAEDGYRATAPVDAYGPQNGFGFHNMVGNVWEWTSSKWVVKDARAPPMDDNTMVKKGGSFLCNHATCNRYRSSARMMFTADSAASNVGFRCAYPPAS